MSIVSLVAAVAARQHGAVHRRQLLAAGASADQIYRALAAGDITRAAPEVFVVAGAPATWRQRLMVAVLDAGPGACVSHRAAAILLGLARKGAPEVVEITSARTRTHRLDGVVVHRLLDLSDGHIIEVDGIPCTGPLRTLVDLGAVENRFEVRDAVERGLSARIVSIKGLEWAVTEHSRKGRNGVGVLRWVLDERALGKEMPDSVLEARMARIYRRFGLPVPAFQHEIRDDGGSFVARVDFAYPDLKIAFEVDGWEAHSTPEQTEADYDRQHRIEALGWTVVRFTYRQVVRRPQHVAEVIATVLGAASRGMRV